jgi:hypothetical protein
MWKQIEEQRAGEVKVNGVWYAADTLHWAKLTAKTYPNVVGQWVAIPEVATPKLRMFRWNGEQVKEREGELTVETALDMYYEYMGDVNRRLTPKVRVGEDNGLPCIWVGEERVKKF